MTYFSSFFKACVHYFSLFLSTNDSPKKVMKNAFYFVQEAFFVVKIFIFLYFHLALFVCQPLLEITKIKLKVQDVINWLKNYLKTSLLNRVPWMPNVRACHKRASVVYVPTSQRAISISTSDFYLPTCQ